MNKLIQISLVMAIGCFSISAYGENLNNPESSTQDISPQNDKTSDLSAGGEITVTTNDMFRGVSMSNNDSAVQGWFGLSYKQFLNAGIYTSSTYFPVPSDPVNKIARRYNVYFTSVYLPIYSDLIAGVQFMQYDFSDFRELNQKEYFLELIYKENLKLTLMNNPNYIGLDTKYQYLSLEYKIDLSPSVTITPLISTTFIEKPEVTDVQNYQEFKVTLTKDLGVVRINTLFSTTNRKKYYTDENYNDSAIAFGVTLPFKY